MLSAPTGVAQLAQAVQDSITMNRFPMSEPTVFNGEPIHFIEWNASFMSLIDQLPIRDPEVRKAQTLQTKTAGQVNITDLLVKFSSWSQAVRAVARL